MKKIELLAPAGDIKCLKAAIEGGADAIYLGGKNFGARAFSKNFSDEEIVEAIKLAHLYGVKIYVTVNTLVYDKEVDSFIKYIEFLHKNNVDAILLQDLGMLDLIRKTYPNLEVHASTQMHIHNLDGVKLMENLGVKRVVLARETSIDDIKHIRQNSNIELEVFVHGALCVSYSGQCLMSYFKQERSANQGECEGSCRLRYNVLNKDKIIDSNVYALSLKDLNSLENIGRLIDVGVSSLKIEGRMKSAAYVYLVTSLYRKAIDSYYKNKKVEIDGKILHDLKIVFNREYTKGFLFNENNNNIVNMKSSNHQGIEVGKVIKSKNNNIEIELSDNVYIGDALRILSKAEDAIILNNFYIRKKLVKEANKGDIISLMSHKKIDIGSKVLKTSSLKITDEVNNIIDKCVRKVPITLSIKAKVNEPLKIVATDGKNSVKKESIVLESSINRPTTKEVLEEKINKISDSVYKINSLKINIDDNVFVPLKIFNDLRREVLIELNKKRLYNTDFVKKEYSIDLPNFEKENNTNILIDSINQYNSLDKNNYKYIYSVNKIDNTILKLPNIINNYDNLKGKYLISEIGALNKLKDVDSDYNLNVVNSYTVAFLHSIGVNKITLSYELSYDDIKLLINTYENRYHKHPNLEVITSSNIEVMTTKFDLNKYYNLNSLELEGNKSKYITRSFDNYMSIYLKEKRIDNNNYFKIGVNNIRKDIILDEYIN